MPLCPCCGHCCPQVSVYVKTTQRHSALDKKPNKYKKIAFIVEAKESWQGKWSSAALKVIHMLVNILVIKTMANHLQVCLRGRMKGWCSQAEASADICFVTDLWLHAKRACSQLWQLQTLIALAPLFGQRWGLDLLAPDRLLQSSSAQFCEGGREGLAKASLIPGLSLLLCVLFLFSGWCIDLDNWMQRYLCFRLLWGLCLCLVKQVVVHKENEHHWESCAVFVTVTRTPF